MRKPSKSLFQHWMTADANKCILFVIAMRINEVFRLFGCQVFFLLWSRFGCVTAFVGFDNNQLESVRTETLLQAVAARGSTGSEPIFGVVGRRNAVLTPLLAGLTLVLQSPAPSHAYTPDPDALRESLYLVCRVQEATCLQERYIEKSRPPIQKMKLTLRLVDKSYRLLDQVNFISKNIEGNNVVTATQLGNEAVDALQEAIDFVYTLSANKQQVQQDGSTSMTLEQRDFLKASLTETREKLFEFLEYLPPGDQAKLLEARNRVEEENKLNKDEFDPDLATDAGVYNPVALPWKDRPKKAA